MDDTRPTWLEIVGLALTLTIAVVTLAVAAATHRHWLYAIAVLGWIGFNLVALRIRGRRAAAIRSRPPR